MQMNPARGEKNNAAAVTDGLDARDAAGEAEVTLVKSSTEVYADVSHWFWK